MIIRQPSASEDRAPIASSAIVAVVCLGAGLWLAHRTMAHPVQIEDEVPTPAAPMTGSEGEHESDESERESESEHESEHESESEHEGESEHESAPAPAPPEPASATPAPAPIVDPATPRPAPPIGTGTATRVRRGRVAYLRCDGAPQTTGPFPCPRDAELEDVVWTAIDGALACQPPLPPGQADLVIDFDREAGATAPAISTRDTFSDEAIRTDAAAVVTCLTPVLSALTTTIPGEHVRVGFRFALE